MDSHSAGNVVLRRATGDDGALLFRWANDRETRRNSLSHEPISWETHIAWLARRLADPGTKLLIAELDGHPVGTVRFDLDAEVVISLTVAPERRGKGLATPIILAACALIDRDVIAEVLPHNEASIRAFLRAGFVREGDRYRYAATIR